MTKRRQTTHSDTADEPGPRGKVVHATDAVSADAVELALWEQLYDINGADSMAHRLAARLRDPSPHPALLAMVARWLDPQSDDEPFKLVVVHQRDKKTWTTKVNDAAIPKALQQELAAGGPKYGMLKRVAKRLEVSSAQGAPGPQSLTPK